MDIEEDDSMEIDESISAAPIIERRSDDFNSSNNPLSEKDQTTHNVNTSGAKLTSDQVPDNTSDSMSKETVNKRNEKVDVVILDDDDDEPMKKAEGN